jgi:hypothetical protein
MRPRKNRIHRADAEIVPASVKEIPVQVTFRHMPVSPAVVERVTREAQKLRRYAEAIKHCRAVVIAPHRHLRHGRRYVVHLDIGLPRQRVAIAHEPPARARVAAGEKPAKGNEVAGSARDLNVEIRRVFDVARRRLQDRMRLLRGDVKRHAPASGR